jgi:hypothetical protein
MKRAINQLIEKELKGVDVYNHNGSTWFIFTEERRWVFEYTKENILWYNYSLFHSVFNFVSLDVTENTKYITDWFTKNILGKPIWTNGDKFVMEKGVVNIIENSIKETEGVVGSNIPIVEGVLENGVKNTWTNEIPNDYNWSEDFDREVEDTIQNGVKNTSSHFPNRMGDVEDTIQNGVKRTLPESIADSFAIEDTIQNGVKHATGAEFVTNVVVENTIQNGVKHTEYGDWLDGDERIGDITQNGIKEIYDDCSDNQARVNGIIKIGKLNT